LPEPTKTFPKRPCANGTITGRLRRTLADSFLFPVALARALVYRQPNNTPIHSAERFRESSAILLHRVIFHCFKDIYEYPF
jgi:hypothetical protein